MFVSSGVCYNQNTYAQATEEKSAIEEIMCQLASSRN